jgi:hypothetical protein
VILVSLALLVAEPVHIFTAAAFVLQTMPSR